MFSDGNTTDGSRDCVGKQDENAILQTIQQFIDGISNLDAEIIAATFHPEATSFSCTSRGVCVEPASTWHQMIDQARSDPNHLFRQECSTRILDIDVVDTAAAAKVEWIFGDTRVVDFYNLLRVDDRWYIVNQVYHLFG
jgi:hypothetical protein